MAVEFKKLSDVEMIETLGDSASVLVEDGGEVKRVPAEAVGGGSGGGSGGGVTWISTANSNCRVWNPSTNAWEIMTKDDFKQAFMNGVVRVDSTSAYPGYDQIPGTVVSYYINDSYGAIYIYEGGTGIKTFQPIGW